MKKFNLTIFLLLVAAIVPAQKMVKTPDANPGESVKMLFAGTIKERLFEMTLTRTGEDLSGSYFFVKSGRRTNTVKLRGKIQGSGKVQLRELNRANQQIGEFRGELVENTDDYDLNFNGSHKIAARRKSSDFFASGQIIGFTGGWRIESEYISERDVRRRMEIDACYPQIRGAAVNLTNVSKVNSILKRPVAGQVAKFKRMVLRQTAEDRKNLTANGNSYSAVSDIKFADNDLISLAYFYSESSNGMIHPMNGVETLNYDLRNRRKLSLADLFKPGANYLETISAYCLKTLQIRQPVNGQKLADGDWASGTEAISENYECWNLMRKGLLITFNEYQIAAYPAGIQSVLIPYEELKSIARSDGALAKMTR